MQKYTNVLTDFREQTKWIALYHCKDGDPLEECLHENDVIQSREEKNKVMKMLAETKHSKFILKTDQPSSYAVVTST